MAWQNSTHNENDQSWINQTIASGTFNSSALQRATNITIWFIVTTFISAVGALLLILLLLSTVQQRKHQSGTQLLIVHLMLLQLLLLGVTFPILNTHSYLVVLDSVGVDVDSGGNVTAVRHQHLIHCPSLMFFHVSLIHTEAWAAFLLAVNRFAATVFPHQYRQMVTKKALIFMLLLPWTIGLGINVPLWFDVGVRFVVGRPYPLCTTRTTGGAYPAVWSTVGNYLPTGLMGIAYGILLMRFLTGGRNRVGGTAGPVEPDPAIRPRQRPKPVGLGGRAARERQLGLTKMLLLSSVWYMICFIPGPVILTGFSNLVARYYTLTLWVVRTLIILGLAASPVSRALVFKA